MGKIMLLAFSENENGLYDEILQDICRNRKVSFIQEFEDKSTIRIENIEINIEQRNVFVKGNERKLTFIEFEILYLLANNPSRVFSKEQIYDIVWNELYFGNCNIVMSHIRNIREKIVDNPSKPIYIQMVWGVGYRFNQNLAK